MANQPNTDGVRTAGLEMSTPVGDGDLGQFCTGGYNVVENEIHRAICRGELKPENVPAAMADWPNLYLEKKAGEPIDWSRY